MFNRLTNHLQKVQKQTGSSGFACVVMRDGRILFEQYDGYHDFHNNSRKMDSESRFNVYSVRVAYISLALAICINQGDVSIDDPLRLYFPEVDSSILGNVTIRDVLTRRAEVKFNNGKFIKREKNSQLEGKQQDIISTIISRVTGLSVSEIIYKNVIKPMDLTSTGWMTTKNELMVPDIKDTHGLSSYRLGNKNGADRNLYVSARDLANFGQLHLQNGLYKGKRILADTTIKQLITIQSIKTSINLPSFGFFWWIQTNSEQQSPNEISPSLPVGTYQILGASGCACTVIPSKNIVAVRMFNSLIEKNSYDYIEDMHEYGQILNERY